MVGAAKNNNVGVKKAEPEPDPNPPLPAVRCECGWNYSLTRVPENVDAKTYVGVLRLLHESRPGGGHSTWVQNR